MDEIKYVLIDDWDEIVFYKDFTGKIHKVRPHHGDEFDKYIGVALAICYRAAGGKTAFKAMVDRLSDKSSRANIIREYSLEDGEIFAISEDKYGRL